MLLSIGSRGGSNCHRWTREGGRLTSITRFNTRLLLLLLLVVLLLLLWQEGQAALHVQLPIWENLTMALGSAPADAAKNEVFLSSSHNTSVVVELPCVAVR